MLDRAHLIPFTGRIPAQAKCSSTGPEAEDSTQHQTYVHRTNQKVSYIPLRTERGKKY